VVAPYLDWRWVKVCSLTGAAKVGGKTIASGPPELCMATACTGFLSGFVIYIILKIREQIRLGSRIS
jgi:hypothetical protein